MCQGHPLQLGFATFCRETGLPEQGAWILRICRERRRVDRVSKWNGCASRLLHALPNTAVLLHTFEVIGGLFGPDAIFYPAHQTDAKCDSFGFLIAPRQLSKERVCKLHNLSQGTPCRGTFANPPVKLPLLCFSWP